MTRLGLVAPACHLQAQGRGHTAASDPQTAIKFSNLLNTEFFNRSNIDEMSYDTRNPPGLENGELNRFEKMDAMFCARMYAAIAQGLESAPIGIVTTPGTKNPKCITNQIAGYDLSRDEQ